MSEFLEMPETNVGSIASLTAIAAAKKEEAKKNKFKYNKEDFNPRKKSSYLESRLLVVNWARLK